MFMLKTFGGQVLNSGAVRFLKLPHMGGSVLTAHRHSFLEGELVGFVGFCPEKEAKGKPIIFWGFQSHLI